MKTYTVEEVSKILNINPETIRRWIREKKLPAERTSKKLGWIIKEKDLTSFLSKTTRYKELASQVASLGGIGVTALSAARIPIAGIPIALGGVFASTLLTMSAEKAKKIVENEDLEPFIESTLLAYRVDVKQKKAELKSLKEKIDVLEQEIKEEERVISDLESLQKQ